MSAAGIPAKSFRNAAETAAQFEDFYTGGTVPRHKTMTRRSPSKCSCTTRVPWCGRPFERLSAIARYLVNIDWSEAWPWKPPEQVCIHDYHAIYSEAGLYCATFPPPEKIDGMQQKLFIASKKNDARDDHLMEMAEEASAAAEAPPPGVSSTARWAEQLQRATAEIMEIVPRGSAFILVNDDSVGKRTGLRGSAVIPFLEHEGRYWGPPENDATRSVNWSACGRRAPAMWFLPGRLFGGWTITTACETICKPNSLPAGQRTHRRLQPEIVNGLDPHAQQPAQHHPTVIHLIRQLKPISILDVGVGFGKWGHLFREYTDINEAENDPAVTSARNGACASTASKATPPTSHRCIAISTTTSTLATQARC